MALIRHRRPAATLVLLLLAIELSRSVSALKPRCLTKKVVWARSGHNEDCVSACRRAGKRKPLSSGSPSSNLCAVYDTLEDTPMPGDWVAGAYRDLLQEPGNAQKLCWIARHFFEPGDDMEQPIAESSNFYCACWKYSKTCQPWLPRWYAAKIPNPNSTCDQHCKSRGLKAVDRVPSSYNYVCRPSSAPQAVGWEHYVGSLSANACHYVGVDAAKEGGSNEETTNYQCLCQKK